MELVDSVGRSEAEMERGRTAPRDEAQRQDLERRVARFVRQRGEVRARLERLLARLELTQRKGGR